MVFIDLDHFKFVNDTLGHSPATSCSRRWPSGCARCCARATRWRALGGDEFVLILNDQSNEEVIFRAMQRITAKVSEPIDASTARSSTSPAAPASASTRRTGADVETLLKNADAAMYRAKEHGRNNFQFYTAEMNERVNERLALENALRRALEREEFMLHYQPKVDLQTGAIVGVEALVRWLHPEWGLVRPARFIPIAEETGLIVQIGEWVLHEACRQARAWQDAGLQPGVVAVNLSARQFRAGRPGAHGVAHPRGDRARPAQLEMELTESMVMHNAEAAIAMLQGLKSLGVTLSVDDFGTGYSSLSYLKACRSTRSRSTAPSCATSARRRGRRRRARAGHHLARPRLHLKVIAEGVETDAQLRFLQRHGCDEVQGFLYGEPVPPEQHAKLLEKAKRKVRR